MLWNNILIGLVLGLVSDAQAGTASKASSLTTTTTTTLKTISTRTTNVPSHPSTTTTGKPVSETPNTNDSEAPSGVPTPEPSTRSNEPQPTVDEPSDPPSLTYKPVFPTGELGLGGEVEPDGQPTETYTSIAWSSALDPVPTETAAPPAAGNDTDSSSSSSTTSSSSSSDDDITLTISSRQQPNPLPSKFSWRSARSGISYLHSVPSQGGCSSCWTFAAVALLETQSRIEHGAWSKRSESDLHDSLGVGCSTTGGPRRALDWVIGNPKHSGSEGLADSHCIPYSGTDQPFYPCGDRSGRALRVPSNYTLVPGSKRDEAKRWISSVGPLTACFTVYEDFRRWNFSDASRAYAWDGKAKSVGGHCVLVVGYDDSLGAWEFRNSWGSRWGNGGYGFIKYGTAKIDNGAKVGIANVNADPWAKKKHRNGILYESGNGATHRNFEVLRSNGTGGLTHVWRRGESPYPWSTAGQVVRLSNGVPRTGQIPYGQPVMLGSSFNRDFEVVYVNSDGRLVEWHYSQNADRWYHHIDVPFGGTTLRGFPGFAQLDDASFSLVVRTSTGSLEEWIREARTGNWVKGNRLAASGIRSSGPALVSSNININFKDRDSGGNLYTAAVLNSGRIQLFWRRTGAGQNTTWNPSEVFGANITRTTPPVMIQDYWRTSDERDFGGFQLLIADDGYVQHWQRINTNILKNPPVPGSRGPWTRVRTFGNGHIKHVWGLVQGSWRGALDAIVEDFNGAMWHYRFSGSPGQWKLVTKIPGVKGG
ncbi:hypothetical protein QBC42DRAFT_318930 [Cladorrhinum samala]|uniref:Peptidase C1A papain C-terminal domain-containing protein n=1 Tax=Cladorrhinum samala TaxID=585594 RepID=A0AAV9I1C4_9PEZI|nr:hypothetical protein QBC42DRAFT_318930 [Cladorrhinum samala]